MLRLPSLAGVTACAILWSASCTGGTPGSSAPEAEPRPSAEPGIVRLDPSTADSLAVRVLTVAPGEGTYEIAIPGEVLPAPENFAIVSAPTGGRIAGIAAHEGEYVRRGQIVLQLESAEFADMAASYLEARADVAFYRSQAERAASLVEQQVSPESALEKAQAELSRAEARVSASYARLRALDVTDEQIEAWQTTTRERPLLPVYAPISGFIDRHEVDLGTSVNAYQEMLSIVDPSRVLVRGFLSPDDAAAARPGTPVTIEQRVGSARSIAARITTVQPALDEANRSLVVNILTPATDGWPVPGQAVRLRMEARSEEGSIRIPTDALVYDADRASVFVESEPGSWMLRAIEIGRMTENEVFVLSGLSVGDRVATSQVFALKALLRVAEYGEE